LLRKNLVWLVQPKRCPPSLGEALDGTDKTSTSLLLWQSFHSAALPRSREFCCPVQFVAAFDPSELASRIIGGRPSQVSELGQEQAAINR
jgi:hypothetical protein